MPTETFQPVYSAKSYYSGQVNQILTPFMGNDVLSALSAGFSHCNWTLVSSTKASVTISFTLGLPTTGGSGTPSIHINCQTHVPLVTINGIAKFVAYDPFLEIPNVSDNCYFFAKDVTEAGTLANLASAMGSAGSWVVTTSTVGGFFLTLTATNTGIGYDSYAVNVDGRWGLGGSFSGGSQTWKSVGGSGYQQFTVTIATEFGGLTAPNNKMDLTFDLGGVGNTVLYQLFSTQTFSGANISPWFIFVGDNWFCMFDSCTNFNATQSIYAVSPFSTGPDTGAFVVNPGQLKGQTYWNKGSFRAIGVNSTLSSPSFGFPQILTLKQAAVPLHTPDNQLINLAPKMSFAWNSEPAQIVGTLPDAIVASDVITGMLLDTHHFVAISSQNGSGLQTASTFLLRAENA